MSPQLVNSLGLLMDAVGVIIVFKYGWPQPDISETQYLILSGKDNDPANEAKRTLHKRMALGGLVCLVMGFGIQIVATWMP